MQEYIYYIVLCNDLTGCKQRYSRGKCWGALPSQQRLFTSS